MRKLSPFRHRGQAAILVALLTIAVVAFVALAVDSGVAYSLRRQAQNAADGAAIAGTYVMVDYSGASPVADILRNVNRFAEANGIPDTNGNPGDPINNNVLAYYVDHDGNRLQLGGVDWELHSGPDVIPNNARGIEAVTAISQTTFFARTIGVNEVAASATATARYQPDGGVLPVAVNEYWAGSQGHCPYDNCEEPFSFVRDPAELAPFDTTDGGATWFRNDCPDPYNENTCQGPYAGYGENYARGFAILGQDAKPNHGSDNPRSGVELDYRYDCLIDNCTWHALIDNEVWMHNVKPISQGGGKQAMEEVIRAGGYNKVPIPRSVHEPPPDYLDGWSYCWDTPSPDNCFNYPESDRSEPYDVVMFLNGTSASYLAAVMWDEENYIDGRFAPGERIVIMVYNGWNAESWGGDHKEDSAVIVGYFGAVIVGYGSDYDRNCSGTPGDWTSYAPCVKRQGNSVPNTAYGIAGAGGDLTIDPSKLLNEFLPKEITLIR
jgi:hypothetical protein